MAQPHRFTISLAQLMLLAMLTALLCVWLPEAVRWNRESLTESPVVLKCVLSQDGSILYSRSSRQGFAVFDTRSGKRLYAEPISAWTDVVFDPCEKQIAVFSDLLEDRYKIRVVNLETGLAQNGVAPRLRPGFWMMAEAEDSQAASLVHGDRVYDFPLVDSTDPNGAEAIAHLRCWSASSGKELFCVQTEDYLASSLDLSNGSVAYVSTLPSPDVGNAVKHVLFFRDMNSGQIQRTVDLSTVFTYPGRFSPYHRSGDLAILNYVVDTHHSITRETEILRTRGEDTPLRIASFKSLAISQLAFDARDEHLWVLGIELNGTQVLKRHDVKAGNDLVTSNVSERGDALVSEFKLLTGGKEVLLAVDDGSLRILDAESGKELRRLTGLRYVPSYPLFLILPCVAGAWLVLWWFATRARPEATRETARILGYAIFLAGFIEGLFLLGFFQRLHEVRIPLALAAIAVPGLLAIVSTILLFVPRFQKATLVYGILACVGMVAYIFCIPS